MKNKYLKGFTLLELAIVLAATALVAGAVAPSFVNMAYIDAARRSALEVAQIQEASRAYYVKNKTWPVDMMALKAEGFLDSSWEARNSFGKPYLLEISGMVLLVKTEVIEQVAGVMAAALPMASTSGPTVISAVTMPGINTDAVPVGALITWPGEDIPAGWMICDGREVSREDHATLFALIGGTYGFGDHMTTFNLPDLRGRVVVGRDNMGGSEANVIVGSWGRQMGATFGEENHVLTVAEMPSHTHGYMETPWLGSRYDGHSSPLMTSQRSATTSATGGSLAHNNIQPSMVMNWIIKG